MHVSSLVVTSLRSNCIVVQYTIARSMALKLSREGTLSKAWSTNRAAAPTNNSTELCDHIFNSLTNNISDREYIGVEDNNLNLTNEVDSLILLHLNIRSLNKYHDDLHEFITLLPFSPDVICLPESRLKQIHEKYPNSWL